jgi:hypothetical protein
MVILLGASVVIRRAATAMEPSSSIITVTDLKMLLNNCCTPQYTRISELGPMVPYKIVYFEKTHTRFGEAIRATVIEGLTGDLLCVYLPQRFTAIFTDTVMESYNRGAGNRLSLVNKGPGKGIEFV